MNDKIEVGDTVTFEFSTHPPITGKVVYMPCATGDSWRVTTEKGAWADAQVYYIQTFDFVRKTLS